MNDLTGDGIELQLKRWQDSFLLSQKTESREESKIQKCFSDVILRDSICPPIHQTKERKEKAVKRNIGRDNEKYLERYQEKY